MKRKVLAILVPALLMAGAANAAEMYNKDGNKVDLYGKVDARHTFSDRAGDDGDETYVQIGFKGETQINNDLVGYGQWEYKTYANDTEGQGDTSFNRLAYAGLKYGEYGSFDYGRNYGVVYDVEAWTDMLPVFGGDSYTWTDNFMNGRANGLATYRNAGFFGLIDGLNVALQYQGNNEGGPHEDQNGNYIDVQEGTKNGHDDVRFQNGDGFGMSTSYDFDFGLSLGAAYSSSDRTNAQEAAGQNNAHFAGGKTAEAWTLGAKYNANSVYLAMMYAETRNMTPYGDYGIADQTQNVEMVAQYQFDFGLRPSLAWVYSKGKDMTYPGTAANPQGQQGDMDLVNYIDLGMTYTFNKNFSTYVDYKINMLDNDESFYEANGISTDDIVGVGMTYQF